MANLSQKRRLLIKATKLKQCSGDFQNIYSSPDLTYNKRQATVTSYYDKSCLITKKQEKLTWLYIEVVL